MKKLLPFKKQPFSKRVMYNFTEIRIFALSNNYFFFRQMNLETQLTQGVITAIQKLYNQTIDGSLVQFQKTKTLKKWC